VNSGLFGRRCSPADTDVLGHQLCLYVFAKPPVRRDKSTRARPPNLASLRELEFTLGFVGPLLFICVERVTDSRQRILLFLYKLLVDAFRRPEGITSVRSLGRRISLVEYVIDAAVDQRVLWLKLVVVLRVTRLPPAPGRNSDYSSLNNSFHREPVAPSTHLGTLNTPSICPRDVRAQRHLAAGQWSQGVLTYTRR
jgi:hypothetical protein